MGMASYYFTLEMKESPMDKEIKRLFEQQYKVSEYQMPSGRLFRKQINDNSRFIIDNKAVVSISADRNITEISFELCFSNFLENLSYMYNVSKWVSSLCHKTTLIVLNSQYDFDRLDVEKFRNIIMQAYSKKYHLFKQQYGEITADILPQKFYSK